MSGGETDDYVKFLDVGARVLIIAGPFEGQIGEVVNTGFLQVQVKLDRIGCVWLWFADLKELPPSLCVNWAKDGF